MESRTFKCEGERNDHTLHYKQVFGNVFERSESKCCAVLMKHCHKLTDKQGITLQMTQQLFCHQCKATFLLGQSHCIDDQDKFQSVTDTDNKFTECQTHENAPVNWHFTCQLTRMYENFKEYYFRSIQSTT